VVVDGPVRPCPVFRHSATHPGASLHETQFYQSFPALVLQATNTGVRSPGYEATGQGSKENEVTSF